MKNFKNHRTSTIDQQLHMDMLCIPLYTYGIFHCQVRLPKRNNIGSIGQMRSFHSHAEETTCKWNISEHFKTTQNPPNTISKQNDIPRGIPIEDNSRIWCLHDVHQCATVLLQNHAQRQIPDSWIFWANIPDTAGAHQLPPFAETSGGHSTILFSMIWESSLWVS